MKKAVKALITGFFLLAIFSRGYAEETTDQIKASYIQLYQTLSEDLQITSWEEAFGFHIAQSLIPKKNQKINIQAFIRGLDKAPSTGFLTGTSSLAETFRHYIRTSKALQKTRRKNLYEELGARALGIWQTFAFPRADFSHFIEGLSLTKSPLSTESFYNMMSSIKEIIELREKTIDQTLATTSQEQFEQAAAEVFYLPIEAVSLEKEDRFDLLLPWANKQFSVSRKLVEELFPAVHQWLLLNTPREPLQFFVTVDVTSPSAKTLPLLLNYWPSNEQVVDIKDTIEDSQGHYYEDSSSDQIVEDEDTIEDTQELYYEDSGSDQIVEDEQIDYAEQDMGSEKFSDEEQFIDANETVTSSDHTLLSNELAQYFLSHPVIKNLSLDADTLETLLEEINVESENDEFIFQYIVAPQLYSSFLPFYTEAHEIDNILIAREFLNFIEKHFLQSEQFSRPDFIACLLENQPLPSWNWEEHSLLAQWIEENTADHDQINAEQGGFIAESEDDAGEIIYNPFNQDLHYSFSVKCQTENTTLSHAPIETFISLPTENNLLNILMGMPRTNETTTYTFYPPYSPDFSLFFPKALYQITVKCLEE